MHNSTRLLLYDMIKDKKVSAYDIKCINEVLEYYHRAGRHGLPWRKNITAYKILVSEVMLQQTQVSRVIDKFHLWNKAFPTLLKLREASLTDILLLWQGLGYQRRAKALVNIAKECQRLPKTYNELLMLPGIGPYTASAICAFAYDTFAHPVLETNIRTVLIEFFHPGEESVHDGVLYDDLSRLESYETVKLLGARHFYYALMDYGAYLKKEGVSHNKKSKHYTVQPAYKGSFRELRAKVLFAITKGEKLPQDERVDEVLTVLEKENYIEKKKGRYVLQK